MSDSFSVKHDEHNFYFCEQNKLVGEIEYEIGSLNSFVLNFIRSFKKGYGTKMIEYIQTLEYPFIQGYLLNDDLVPFYEKFGAVFNKDNEDVYFEIRCLKDETRKGVNEMQMLDKIRFINEYDMLESIRESIERYSDKDINNILNSIQNEVESQLKSYPYNLYTQYKNEINEEYKNDNEEVGS